MAGREAHWDFDVGVLTRGDLLTGLAKQSQFAPVGDVMQRNVCTADVGEMVESVAGCSL